MDDVATPTDASATDSDGAFAGARQQRRLNVLEGNGTVPFYVEVNPWSSQQLQSAVAGILAAEVVGVEVEYVFAANPKGTTRRLYGCPREADDLDAFWACEPGVTPRAAAGPASMVSLEAWATVTEAPGFLEGAIGKAYQRLGYGVPGRVGIYVDDGLVRDAWQEAREVANHWRGWQSPWTLQAAANVTVAVPAEGQAVISPAACSAAGARCPTMLAHVPDLMGAEPVEDMVAALGMLLEVSYVGHDVEAMVTERLQNREHVVFQHWVPDIMMARLARKLGGEPSLGAEAAAGVSRVFLPARVPEELLTSGGAEGGPPPDAVTDFPPTGTEKLAWSALGEASPELLVLMSRFAPSMGDMDALFASFLQAEEARQQPAEHGDLVMEAACDWVRANRETWRPWIQCAGGEGYDYAAEACRTCAPGFAPGRAPGASALDPPTCVRCSSLPPGMQQVSGCWQCPLGHERAGGTCRPCAKGHYSDNPGSRCLPCPLDTFAAVEGQARCLPCKKFGEQYQDEMGQDFCKPCPANTQVVDLYDMSDPGVLASLRPDERWTSCQCNSSFWRPDGVPDRPCQECPDGGRCPGRLDPAEPLPGHWAKYVNASGSNDTNSLKLAGYPFECVSDERDGQQRPGEPDICEVDTIFFACPGDGAACLGGKGAPCAEGSQGNLCRLPASNHFVVAGHCLKCPPHPWDLVSSYLGIAGVIAVWVLVNMLTAGSYNSLDIGLQYMQYVATVQAFSLQWPETLDHLTQTFSVFNFSPDFVSFDCIRLQMPLSSFYLNMVLPMAWLAFNAACALLAWIWFRLAYSSDDDTAAAISSSFSQQINEAFSSGFSWLPGGRLMKPSWLVSDRAELHAYWRSCLRSSMNMLIVVYNSLCIVTFQSFTCFDLPDGTRVVSSYPDVPCNHGPMLGTAVLGLLFYVIGIPLAFFLLLAYLRRRNVMNKKEVLELFGWLYTRYEPGLWYWECVILMRRLWLSFIAVFLVTRPELQVALSMLLVIFSVAGQFYYRPFVQGEVDVVDGVGLVSLGIYILAGSVYPAAEGRSADQAIISAIIIMVTLATLLLIGFFFLWEHRQMQVAAWCESRLASFSSESYTFTCLKIAHEYPDSSQLLEHLSHDDETAQTTEMIDAERLASLIMALHADSPYGPEDSHLVLLTLNPDAEERIAFQQIADAVYSCSAGEEERAKHRSRRKSLSLGFGFNSSRGSRKLQALEPRQGPGSVAELLRNQTSIKRSVTKMSVVSDKARRQMRFLEDDYNKTGGELASTLRPSALGPWLRGRLSAKDWDAVADAARLDQRMSGMLADNSEMSAYSYNLEAVVYRAVLASHPCLLALVMMGSDEQREAFRVLMNMLLQEATKPSSNLAEIVHEQDRAPLVHWFVNTASEQDRALCHAVITSVFDTYMAARPKPKEAVVRLISHQRSMAAGAHAAVKRWKQVAPDEFDKGGDAEAAIKAG